MILRNSMDRYGFISKLLHWAMAFLILDLVVMGLAMTELPPGEQRTQIYDAHKMIGMTALALLLLRTGWRALDGAPGLPASLGPAQQRLTGVVHGLMYLLMLVVPMLGVLVAQSDGAPVPFFFELPAMVARDKPLHETLSTIHGACAITLGGLAIGHALVAVAHHYIWQDNVLRRMTRWRRSTPLH